MADATIEIVLELQDKMSKQLSVIQKDLGNLTKETQKNTEKLTQGFTKTTDSLIALGNVASSVDRIFDSYNNLQLRLENANERLANAQDRVTDSQERLNRLQRSGTATSEELSDAQKELERANRGLTISENNLQKAQNAVVGTYISIGLQVTSLIRSLPVLIGQINATTISVNGLKVALAPIVAIATVITVAIGGLVYVQNKLNESNKEIESSALNLEGAISNLADETARWNTALTITQNKLKDIFVQKSSEQLDKEAQRARLVAEKAELIQKGRDANTLDEVNVNRQGVQELDAKIKSIDREIEVLETRRQYNEAELTFIGKKKEEELKSQESITDGLQKALSNRTDITKVFNQVQQMENDKLYADELEKVQELEKAYTKALDKKEKLLGKISTVTPGVTGIFLRNRAPTVESSSKSTSTYVDVRVDLNGKPLNRELGKVSNNAYSI